MRARTAGLRGLIGALHNFSTPVTGGKSAVLHGFSYVLVNLGTSVSEPVDNLPACW
jgi:hypothetical protein